LIVALLALVFQGVFLPSRIASAVFDIKLKMVYNISRSLISLFYFLAQNAEENAMKKVSLLWFLVSFFAIVASAAAQEKYWRIPGIGLGIKVQSPIQSSPRSHVGATYSSNTANGTSSTESEIQTEAAQELAARRRNIPNENVDMDTQRKNSGIPSAEDIEIVPAGTKQEVPNFKRTLVGVELRTGYNPILAAKVQKEVGKLGANFAKLPLGAYTSCVRPRMLCVVIYNAEPFGKKQEGGSSSWYGDRYSSYGSSNSNSTLYFVTVSVQILTNDGTIHLLGAYSKVFDVPNYISSSSSGGGYGSHGGYGSSGDVSVTYDQNSALAGASAKAAEDAVKHLLHGGIFSSGSENWQPDAAALVREAFKQ
jgi:hypothetical protein